MFKGRYWTRNKHLVLVMEDSNGIVGYTLLGELVRLRWDDNGFCVAALNTNSSTNLELQTYDLMNKVNPQTKDNEIVREEVEHGKSSCTG